MSPVDLILEDWQHIKDLVQGDMVFDKAYLKSLSDTQILQLKTVFVQMIEDEAALSTLRGSIYEELIRKIFKELP